MGERHQPAVLIAIGLAEPLLRSSATSLPRASWSAIERALMRAGRSKLVIRPGSWPPSKRQSVRPVAGLKPSTVTRALADATGSWVAVPLTVPTSRVRSPTVGLDPAAVLTVLTPASGAPGHGR